MDFLPAELSEYVENHTSEESPLLKKIDHFTNEKMVMPRMLSGHLQGRVLAMLSKLMRPKTILEIGTFTGYSALCLAEGLEENGKIITIDINEELEDVVTDFFNQSPYGHMIDYRIGNALDIIPELNEIFDMVFIDADKENYLNYYDLIMEKLNPGGILIADNVLWSGKVIKKSEKKDKDIETEGLKLFNQKVHADDRVENVLLPIRDGLMIVRKND